MDTNAPLESIIRFKQFISSPCDKLRIKNRQGSKPQGKEVHPEGKTDRVRNTRKVHERQNAQGINGTTVVDEQDKLSTET